jgi:hypothetical protein
MGTEPPSENVIQLDNDWDFFQLAPSGHAAGSTRATTLTRRVHFIAVPRMSQTFVGVCGTRRLVISDGFHLRQRLPELTPIPRRNVLVHRSVVSRSIRRKGDGWRMR